MRPGLRENSSVFRENPRLLCFFLPAVRARCHQTGLASFRPPGNCLEGERSFRRFATQDDAQWPTQDDAQWPTQDDAEWPITSRAQP